MSIPQTELDTRFTDHPPAEGQPEIYRRIRAKGKELAELINEVTPPSREQSLALTAIEESVMWGNAAVARRS
jgi:hypothetical protein